MGRAVFFQSAGRCGTQSLARAIGAVCPHAVRHEPIDYLKTETALKHLDEISQAIHNGTFYVETGWTSWAFLPLTKGILGKRVTIVSIHRDPVEQATSLRSQGIENYDHRLNGLLGGLSIEDHIDRIGSMPSDYRVYFRDMFNGRSGSHEVLAPILGCDAGDLAEALKEKVDLYG